MIRILGMQGILVLTLYAGMVSRGLAAFDQSGNPTGAWHSRDGVILVLTCFRRLGDHDHKCGSTNELKVLLVNNSNRENTVGVECYRLSGDTLSALAGLVVKLEPLAHTEYSFKSEIIGTAPSGSCHLSYPSTKKLETTPGWVKLK